MVIPASLQPKVLEILHIGHFGMQRMKHLARTTVYWPGIDSCIVEVSRTCQACAEHQNKPPKPPVHPWMFPEKPWSRVHVDHAINFLGSNWLVLTDAYSNYPCIHQTSSTSSKAAIDLLEEDFAHFGYPHILVSDDFHIRKIPGMVQVKKEYASERKKKHQPKFLFSVSSCSTGEHRCFVVILRVSF